MNCPSRTDEPFDAGYNQNPPHLSADLTTTADLNGIVNSRVLRRTSNEPKPEEISSYDASIREPPGEKGPQVSRALRASSNNVETIKHAPVGHAIEKSDEHEPTPAKATFWQSLGAMRLKAVSFIKGGADEVKSDDHVTQASDINAGNRFYSFPNPGDTQRGRTFFHRVRHIVIKYAKFIGPGFMISVAYIDPGNYSTDVAAGASFRFKLLFVVLLSNIFAVFLQSLCIKLGTVTGLNLAENCRAHCPKWLNISLYILAEIAIIATDMAEVIGTAIALNLLNSKIPLVAGCAISIIDVFLILILYRPNGAIKGLQIFEMSIALLVIGVVVSFCFELSLIKDVSPGEVFRGYLPSSALVKSKGLYQACGILGATVMPHSLYLGSGIVQPRLVAFDIKHGYYSQESATRSSRTSISTAPSSPVPEEEIAAKTPYKPSLAAINFCLKYSIIEVGISLFTFALFVNSAILIVAGASLSNNPTASDADLFGIHTLLSTTLAPAAGTIFALALLLSGISAGVICTIAGQMVSEGALNWSLKPWQRRLVTRGISITPSIIIAGVVGKDGLSEALNASQVVLSIVLPFVSAPLIWFTCCAKFMGVEKRFDVGGELSGTSSKRNSRVVDRQQSTEGPAGVENNRSENTANIVGSEGTTAGLLPPRNILPSPELEAGTQNHGNRNGGGDRDRDGGIQDGQETKNGTIRMENHWITTVVAVVIWIVIAVMNVANLALLKNQ